MKSLITFYTFKIVIRIRITVHIFVLLLLIALIKDCYPFCDVFIKMLLLVKEVTIMNVVF